MPNKNLSRGRLSICLLLCLSLIAVLAGCVPLKKTDLRLAPGLDQEERETAALTHFSYAQYLAQTGQSDRAVEELKTALSYDPKSVHLRTVLAYMLLQQGKVPEALETADAALKLAPDNATLHFVRGKILLEAEKPDDAEAEFRRAAELEPDRAEFTIALAESQLRAKKIDAALATLQAFSAKHPADLDSQFYIAVLLQAKGQVKQAELAYRRMLEQAPGFYPAQRNLFNLYYDNERWEEAVAAGRELLLFFPDDLETRLGVARALVRLERDEEAIIVLEQGKAVEPRPALFVGEGFIYLDQERPKEAREQFLGALALDPRDRQANYGLGLAALQLLDRAEAKKQFEAIPMTSPLYYTARKRLAWIALQDGKPDEAIAIAQQLYEALPREPDAVITYAAILREAGRSDEAEAALKKAIAEMPKEDDLNYELALLYSVRGDDQQARELAEKLLLKHPDDPRALNFLGYLLADKGLDLDRAEQLIRKALEKDPDAGYILDSLGWVHYQRKDYKTALKYLQDAEREAGPDAEILEHLGDCCRALGKKADARNYYQRALAAGVTPRIQQRIEQKLKELK